MLIPTLSAQMACSAADFRNYQSDGHLVFAEKVYPGFPEPSSDHTANCFHRDSIARRFPCHPAKLPFPTRLCW